MDSDTDFRHLECRSMTTPADWCGSHNTGRSKLPSRAWKQSRAENRYHVVRCNCHGTIRLHPESSLRIQTGRLVENADPAGAFVLAGSSSLAVPVGLRDRPA